MHISITYINYSLGYSRTQIRMDTDSSGDFVHIALLGFSFRDHCLSQLGTTDNQSIA